MGLERLSLYGAGMPSVSSYADLDQLEADGYFLELQLEARLAGECCGSPRLVTRYKRTGSLSGRCMSCRRWSVARAPVTWSAKRFVFDYREFLQTTALLTTEGLNEHHTDWR